MPNYQEHLTVEMTQYLISQETTSHQNSPEAAISDWCIMGLQSGFRCSELYQPRSSKSLPLTTKVNKNILYLLTWILFSKTNTVAN